jgi:DNA-binding transcriptional LysR family regulator
MGGHLQVAIFDKTASNPASRIPEAIALFAQQAPEVTVNLHVATLNAIERGVLDGQFHVGVIPGHRSSDTLEYALLFDESMFLYCGARHPLFGTAQGTQGGVDIDWSLLRNYPFAGLGYHSPNMEISLQMRLPRKATGFDQESIATLILSGQFLGFLPIHYAQSFVAAGQMRAVHPDVFHYECSFFGITRRSPQPSRVTRAFNACLLEAHAIDPDPT